MSLTIIKKGPFLRAFFFILLLAPFHCSHNKKNSNFFSEVQKSNVQIFTVRDFFTQEKYQLYFDIFNKNEDVTIGRMAIYVFDKDCKNVSDNEKSNNIIYSNNVFIGPYKNGVITFFPKKRLKCYTVMGFEKYL